MADRWWVFAVLPPLGLGLFFLLNPLFAGGPYYLSHAPSDPYRYWWLFLIAFVPYALAISALVRTGRTPSPRAVFLGFLVVAVPLTFAPLPQSRDAFEYLFYAKLQLAHGANPYITQPAAFSHDPWFAYVGWPHAVSAYGPLWSLTVVALTAVSAQNLAASLVGLKLLASVMIGAAVWGLATLRHDRDGAINPRGCLAMLAFAFNPLILGAGPLGGHVDAVLAPCFVWAMVCDQRRRPILAGLLLAVGVLVKAYAVFPLLVYGYVLLRRHQPRALATIVAGSIGLASACYAPYWSGWRTVGGTLSKGSSESSGLAGTVQSWLDSGAGWFGFAAHGAVASTTVRVIGAATVVATMIWLGRSPRTLRQPWWAAAVLLAVFLLATPWFLPWYAVGILALVAPLSDLAIGGSVFLFSGTTMFPAAGLAAGVRTVLRYGQPLAFGWLLRRVRLPAASPVSITRSADP